MRLEKEDKIHRCPNGPIIAKKDCVYFADQGDVLRLYNCPYCGTTVATRLPGYYKRARLKKLIKS